MSASERNLEKVYNPKEVEDRLFSFWLEKQYFHGEINPGKKPYTIVIPPPNVTDRLHIGHAFNNTYQDVLIRFYKMRGLETEWMPGTDHAGIATQNVVERDLAKTEKKTRHDLGREAFVQRVWAWKEKYGSIIIEQLKKLGCACDWERTRFTGYPVTGITTYPTLTRRTPRGCEKLPRTIRARADVRCPLLGDCTDLQMIGAAGEVGSRPREPEVAG
jgi:isoleucyl-tRNA synthetase